MNVAFWSNSHRSGVTSFAAVAGMIGAQIFDRRVVLSDNHFSSSGMADILLENKWTRISSDERFYLESGSVMRMRFIAKHVGKRTVDRDILEILEDRLWFDCREPAGGELQYERYGEYRPRYGPGGKPPEHELCFVDTDCGFNLTTKDVLDKAEVVVVIMPDKRAGIEDLFSRFSSLKDKSIFVLNRHIAEDHVDPDQICKTYGLERSRLIVAPYDEAFETAALLGRVTEYVITNADRSHEEKQSDFIESLMKLVVMIVGRLRDGAVSEVIPERRFF